MNETSEAHTAVDAVRCLYLAAVAEREGHADAARRWSQMADGWLNRLEPETIRCTSLPTDAS